MILIIVIGVLAAWAVLVRVWPWLRDKIEDRGNIPWRWM
jgi:hypothetical protein